MSLREGTGRVRAASSQHSGEQNVFISPTRLGFYHESMALGVNDEQLVKGQTAVGSSGIVVLREAAVASWRVRRQLRFAQAASRPLAARQTGGWIYQNTLATRIASASTFRSLVFIDFTKLDSKAVGDTRRRGVAALSWSPAGAQPRLPSSLFQVTYLSR